jgi:hypothetical protein
MSSSIEDEDIALDDPHKPEEAQSDAVRERVIDWHDQTWTTRLNDADSGVQVIVMQRLHERDLAGHVLERGGYEQLCLPAEYEPAHPFCWPRDSRTKPGEVLWRGKWDRPWLTEKARELGSYGYAGQYQQRPSPGRGRDLQARLVAALRERARALGGDLLVGHGV